MQNEFSVVKRFTPTIDTQVYASGDQVGPGSTKLTNVVYGVRGITRLRSIKVIDAAKQKSGLDFLFFNSLPTVASVDQGAYDVTDAEAQAKAIGIASVEAGDYKDLNSNSIATVILNPTLMLQAEKNTASPEGMSLWVAIISRGTPTYGAATALTVEFDFA